MLVNVYRSTCANSYIVMRTEGALKLILNVPLSTAIMSRDEKALRLSGFNFDADSTGKDRSMFLIRVRAIA